MVWLWSKRFQATYNVNTDFLTTWAFKEICWSYGYLESQQWNTMSFIKTGDILRAALLSFGVINPDHYCKCSQAVTPRVTQHQIPCWVNLKEAAEPSLQLDLTNNVFLFLSWKQIKELWQVISCMCSLSYEISRRLQVMDKKEVHKSFIS